MPDYGLDANGCLAHHFWHVRYLGTAILHSAKLFWQISNMPYILNNCAEFELIANSSWFWILMKIVFRWNYFLVILSVVKWPITIFFTKHMGLDGTVECHTFGLCFGITFFYHGQNHWKLSGQKYLMPVKITVSTTKWTISDTKCCWSAQQLRDLQSGSCANRAHLENNGRKLSWASLICLRCPKTTIFWPFLEKTENSRIQMYGTRR